MSSYYDYTKLDEAEFTRLSSALAPQAIPIEQTPFWGKFDEALSERTFLGCFKYEQNGKLIALAAATLYTQRGRNWIWIKHGPIFAHEPNTETIKKMCTTLKNQFRQTEAGSPLFIRISAPHRVSPLVKPFESTMYDQTVVLDLSLDEADILSAMSQGGRQGIRKAEKAGVTVKEVAPEEATKEFSTHLYPILAETGKRGGFGIHPESLYTTMLDQLQPFVRLFVAQYKNTPVAWAITTEYDNRALYYYGASDNTARDTHAPYLLHWEIIKQMKARGNKIYDFMGIAGKNYPSLANVTTFKLKFSKNIIDTRPAYDLPLQPVKYHLLAQAIKTKRKLR